MLHGFSPASLKSRVDMRDTFHFRMTTFSLVVSWYAFLIVGLPSGTADAAEPQLDQPLRPTHAAQTMIVPDGFNVTLFAGEPDHGGT